MKKYNGPPASPARVLLYRRKLIVMAIVTPVMLKFMYNDAELTDLTKKTNKLLKQHMEETAVRNKEFRLPTPKDKRSLAFQYEHLNLLKPKFAISPEKRRPLHVPHPNSPHYREPVNADDGLNVDDFDYRYDIESDNDDQAGEDEVGKQFLRRSASAASPLRGGANSLRSLRGQSPDPKLSYSKQFYREGGRLVQSLDWGLDLALQGPGLSLSMVASQNAGGRGALASPGPGATSFLHTNGRGPETSKFFMKKRRQRLEAQQDALYKQVFEEARRLQLRFTTLVKEANAFAQALGHVGTRYRIVERAVHEDAAWDRILRDYEGRGKGRGGGWSLLDGPGSPPTAAAASADENISIPVGTGKRIEKMLVEVTEEGRDVRYLGGSHFQSEHKRLQAAVNKQLAIKPITPVMDPDEEERKLQAAVLAAAENESHHNNHHGAGRSHGGQSAIDHVKTMSHGHSHSHGATNVDASEQTAREKADQERALLLKSGLRPPRHEVEDKLRQILATQTVKVITLQKQLAKIQQMGWNKGLAELLGELGAGVGVGMKQGILGRQ